MSNPTVSIEIKTLSEITTALETFLLITRRHRVCDLTEAEAEALCEAKNVTTTLINK